jgi:WD40 repeat protein
MPRCPPVDHFERLLADELNSTEEEALDRHLRQCATCRQTLELLTAPPAESGAPALTGQAASEPHAEFIDRLKADLVAAAHTRPDALAAEIRPLPRLPDYEIQGLLGHGGMGVVYRAQQISLNRTVALKMILGGAFATAKSQARFRAEAAAIARLQHPNIVQIYEIGEAEGLPYFSQEYVEGGTLAAHLDGAPLPPPRAAGLCELLARAVQFAHDRGIVHRDLKPANILLTTEGAPKVADFGLAKSLSEDGARAPVTQSGIALGTPRYMAPEQLAPFGPGRIAPGRACDIYALGVILYELLSGQPLYAGDTPLDVMVRVLHEDPTPPRVYRPNLPRDLETICLKCLAKAPSGRYASARDLADDLHRFLIGEPVRARRPSLLYRSERFIRRNKALVGAAAGIGLALAAGILATGLMALSEAQQRYLADRNAHQADVARQEAVQEAYQARIAAALAALGDHNVREAADELAPVPPERRGWEWHYASARLDDSMAAFRGYGHHVTLCPDGRQFASITDEGICLWDMGTRQRSALVATGTPFAIHVALTPSSGIVTLPDDRSDRLRLLDAHGRVQQQFTIPGNVSIHTLRLDRSGRRLACAWSKDHATEEFTLFDVASARQLIRFNHPSTAEVRSIDFSPDGGHLVTGSEDGLVRVWDAATGACVQTLRGHVGYVNQVVVSPNGRRVLSCGVDQTFLQWDMATGQLVDERYGHVDQVNAAVYSPDGRWIATAGADSTIRYWRTSGGPAVAVLLGHTAPVSSLAFTPDGRRVVSLARDDEVRVWGGPMGANPRVLKGHTSFVYPVAYSPDGKTIASGAWDHEVRLWDAVTGAPRAVLRGHTHYIGGLAFSPDSRRLVSRGADNTLRVWDVGTGKAVALLHDGRIRDAIAPHNIAFTPDGNSVAWVLGNQLKLWHPSAGDQTSVLSLPAESARLVEFSKDGRCMAVVGDGPEISIIESASRKSLLKLEGHAGRVNAVSFSRAGDQLVSGGADGTVRLWDAATGKCLRILRRHTDEVFAVVFHPDGNRIASAGRDRIIRIWDPGSGTEVAGLAGHANYVFSLAFSPDGATLVSGSGDYTVRLWDTFPLARRLQAR